MPEGLGIATGPKPNHMTFAIDCGGKAGSAGDPDWKAQIIFLLNDCTRLGPERVPGAAALAEIRGRTNADYVPAVINAGGDAMSGVAHA